MINKEVARPKQRVIEIAYTNRDKQLVTAQRCLEDEDLLLSRTDTDKSAIENNQNRQSVGSGPLQGPNYSAQSQMVSQG